MSTPPPASPSRPNGPSAAQRYLFVFFVGLAVGAVATVLIVRAFQARADRFPSSVMQVVQWHSGRLRAKVEENRCAATDLLPHLRAMRTLADDLEPAFPDLRDDKRFAQAASQLRRTLDANLATPPLNCAGLESAMRDIGNACQACHQDFRG